MRKKVENVEAPKAKKQKIPVKKIMPEILPPESQEAFTGEKLFNYLYFKKKISPNKIKISDYRQYVKETVLMFKGIGKSLRQNG